MKVSKRMVIGIVAMAVMLLLLSVPTMANSLIGDANHDGSVNVLDLILVGQSWQLTGEPGWVAADMNTDGAVNILDLIMVCQHFTG